MRVLHVPYSFYPDPAGGTEVYVDGLARAQRLSGCVIAIAAPGDGPAKYDHAGIPVSRFPVSSELNLRDLYGNGDKIAAEAFGDVLDDFAPNVVHLHAVTSAISILMAQEAVDRHIPIVLNYHTPTVSCSRGTLLRWGTIVCDGRLDRVRCAACTLQGHGVARPIAKFMASLPPVGFTDRSGGKWTALRMPELIELRIDAFHKLIGMVERVVALCEWSRELLLRNHVPADKIALCRQGIAWKPNESSLEMRRLSRLPLRAAFLGRFDKTKGVHILAQALKDNPLLPVELDLYGVRQGDAGNRYAEEIRAMIAGDARIRILPPLESGEVVHRLRDYDLIAVPSQWLETGPLVVLEAFAAGIPVIGSKLGGIAELVTDGVDGLLVEPAESSAAWADRFHQLCRDPDLRVSLRARVQPPRNTRQMATEMVSLYEAVVKASVSCPTA